MIAMRRFGVDPSMIGSILVTHLHGDHFGGLPFFILGAQYVSKRKEPLVVAGPPGLEARVYEAIEIMFPGLPGSGWDLTSSLSSWRPGPPTLSDSSR